MKRVLIAGALATAGLVMIATPAVAAPKPGQYFGKAKGADTLCFPFLAFEQGFVRVKNGRLRPLGEGGVDTCGFPAPAPFMQFPVRLGVEGCPGGSGTFKGTLALRHGGEFGGLSKRRAVGWNEDAEVSAYARYRVKGEFTSRTTMEGTTRVRTRFVRTRVPGIRPGEPDARCGYTNRWRMKWIAP